MWPRVKKRVSERVLQRAMHIIRSETLGRRLASAKSLAKTFAEAKVPRVLLKVSPRVWEKVSARLLVRLSARLLARLFARAKRHRRVSDRITRVCMTLRKTLRDSFYYAGHEPRKGTYDPKNRFSDYAWFCKFLNWFFMGCNQKFVI